MTTTRFYNTSKAKRALINQQILIRKLHRSLNNRQEKEKFWENEIKAIDTSYVNLNCKTCGVGIQVKFNDWQNGKYGRICQRCKDNQIRNDLNNICNQVQPLLLDGYVIHQRGIDNQLIIRKKE